MNQKLYLKLNQMNFGLNAMNSMNSMSKIGRRFAANVTNIANKTQITSGNSKPQTMKCPISPKNIILRHCSPIPSMTVTNQLVESVPMSTIRRPLTLIFAWMLAQEKHLEKYRQLWFRRGFDVLTVKTSPLDLLLPPIGGRIVSQNLVKYLTQIHDQYNEVVVHAFSVGGYQFGETLSQMRAQEEDEEEEEREVSRQLLHSIKGVIFDSCVFTEDCAPGLSRAITLNPVIQPLIESSIDMFLKFSYSVSVAHYERASEAIFNPRAPYPGLVLYSKDDLVSNYRTNERLVENWIKLGNNVRSKCWSESTHVLHYRDHQLEYERELDSFIKSLKLRNSF